MRERERGEGGREGWRERERERRLRLKHMILDCMRDVTKFLFFTETGFIISRRTKNITVKKNYIASRK